MKIKLFTISLVLFGLLISSSQAFSAQVLGLKDCVELALAKNQDLEGLQYDIYSSVSRKIEATKRYVPVVKYKYRFAPVPRDIESASESFFSGDISVLNSIRLEAGIPVSTFGRLTLQKQLADLGIDASQMFKQRKADEVILDVYRAYYGILLARELRVLANKGLDAVRSKVAELEKEETTDQLQILKLKAILYQVEKKLDEANQKELVADAGLKFLMGLPHEENIILRDKYLKKIHFKHRSLNQHLKKSQDNRPEYKLLDFQVQEKQMRYGLAKKEYLPNLYLGGFFDYANSPGIRGEGNTNDFTNPFNYIRAGVGFELKGELDFRKLMANSKRAKADFFKAVVEKSSKTKQLNLDLKRSYLELSQRRKLLNRAEKEQRSARQIVFLTKSNLDIGLGEKKDYLEALQSYLLIQAAVYENVYQYNVAVARLKQKDGTLYDPSALKRPLGQWAID